MSGKEGNIACCYICILYFLILFYNIWTGDTCEAEFYFTFVFLVFFGSIIDPETYLFFVRSSEKHELFSRDCFTETQMKLSRVPKSDVGVISHHCCAGSSPLAYEQGPEHLQRLYETCTLRNYKSRSASQAAFSNSRAKEN